MRKIVGLSLLLGIVLILLVAFSGVVQGQTNYPLDNCRNGAFSTSEDFMMTQGEPYDGNPYISDGDVLSPSGLLCARNADLLRIYNPAGVAIADLGLDALDILEYERRIVAFSTELDDWQLTPKFTAGDLLFTTGGVIPNQALVHLFGIRYDIGLDALHFIGDPAKIVQFALYAREIPADQWLNGRLQSQLKERGIDILFSIEGTHRADNLILDGDLLSAATGTIVVSNHDLLPNSVPAGLPVRGVDFGLDAVTAARVFADQRFGPAFFSTEILFRGDPPFNDGDILRQGNGVVVQHEVLIQNWHPRANFLGLDALSVAIGDEEPPKDPNIQTMCGDRPVVDFQGGIVPVNGAGLGLYLTGLVSSPPGTPPRQPCGEYVPIDGYLPSSGVNRFRVAYRPAGAGRPGPNVAAGIRTRWVLYRWYGWPINACLPTGNLETSATGWMVASDYLGAKDGTLTGCANSGLRLAVWDTANHLGWGPPNKDGHYVVWLEWEDGGGFHQEPFDHHLQLDNTLPKINDLRLVYEDTNGNLVPVLPCGETNGNHIFQVWGEFADDYYWAYLLRVRGGNPPTSKYYGWHNYYDGTPEVANTDDTGTVPDATGVFLRKIDMTDLGSSFVDCCYDLDLWVRDAAIRHSFNFRVANDTTGSNTWWDNRFLTFAASP